MFPTLFRIGPFAVNSFGLMLALSFFVSVWYLYRRSRAEKLLFDQVLTIAYLLIFTGLLGARIGFVALHWHDYAEEPLSAINPFQGDQFGISGLNLYTGVVLAVIVCYLYLRIKRLPMLAVMDLFAPTLGIGLGVARIGCFLNGCCFGQPTNLPWGFSFPPGSIPDMILGQQAIHPAQLYSSAYGIILFIILYQILKHKRFDGQVVAVMFMIEAAFRYLIEYVRYYEEEMMLSFLGMHPTFNQIVSLLLFLTGVIIFLTSPRLRYRDGSKAGS